MEESYGCRRMRQAHEFLIKVENFGGEFNGAIDILLEDRRMWIERVYELEKNRSNLKVKITISWHFPFDLRTDDVHAAKGLSDAW